MEKQASVILGCLKGGLQFLLAQPVEQHHEFLAGIPEGFVLYVNAQGSFAGDRGRTDIYLLLLMFWPEVIAMQQADPPKSRKDLLGWLEQQSALIGEAVQLVEDEKQFFALCDDIGLVMKRPGPPVNQEG